jgi:hypothetical protein
MEYCELHPEDARWRRPACPPRFRVCGTKEDKGGRIGVFYPGIVIDGCSKRSPGILTPFNRSPLQGDWRFGCYPGLKRLGYSVQPFHG